MCFFYVFMDTVVFRYDSAPMNVCRIWILKYCYMSSTNNRDITTNHQKCKFFTWWRRQQRFDGTAYWWDDMIINDSIFLASFLKLPWQHYMVAQCDTHRYSWMNYILLRLSRQKLSTIKINECRRHKWVSSKNNKNY